MARPKWQPKDLKTVERLASRGLTQAQIAASLGISEDTITARKHDLPGFADALKKGQARGLHEVANALFEAAIGGNTTAQIFFLKNRSPESWGDKQQLEHGGGIGVKQQIDYKNVFTDDTLVRIARTYLQTHGKL